MTDHAELKGAKIALPASRVIRKRVAARTISIHLSALPPELQALQSTVNDYLVKQDLPDQVDWVLADGSRQLLSRDEAWVLADEAGARLEWDILPDTLAGKTTAFFSATGQGVYANYGRPCLDFSSFVYDGFKFSGQSAKSLIAPQGFNGFMLGPTLIAVDTASAAGFTALGHITRGARLSNKTVLADVISTSVFEGSTSLASAKIGVLTATNAMRLAMMLPIPGARLAAIPVGILVGFTTAIITKHLVNKGKNLAIDAAQRSAAHSTKGRENLGVALS